MTRAVVLAVGRPRDTHLRGAVAEYERRVSHYFRFEAIEVRPAGLADDRAERARSEEAAALERRIPDDLELVALTRLGVSWSTRRLADFMRELGDLGRPGVAFAIGGAHGLGESVLARATRRIRLSEMTLPHELARLVLTEQLYRAGTILRGEPYHKGS
ncbi:MAG: 23S rRNA (pseudouridine(1915)-N(3))-methyltransferase RlmH [Gemmatimonadetes bacterium]|nr:23S rRNA (pseudouridine(1915)-N(3))-methyltransferase RlmH [Gemmatimonadota bacterium]